MRAVWQTEPDATSVADAACRLVGIAAHSAIQEHGEFRLVLAGGTTPLAMYRRLAVSDQEWGRWSLYYGDERCVPPDHPQRNSHQVAQTGLVARAGRHYPIPAELGAVQAADGYQSCIDLAQPFDMVLLGMGGDGHTASLFPARDWPAQDVFAVMDAPKPPPERVTLGIAALQNCRTMLVLVTGTGKAAALNRWRGGADLPIARVCDVAHARVLVERKCLTFADSQSDTGGQAIESVR